MLTQQRVRDLLSYNPDTGTFVWIKPTARRVRVGDLAGYNDGGGYLRVSIDGKKIKNHRLVWLYVYGYLPDGDIDHINGIKDDNRISNLRFVSHKDNSRNRAMNVNNRSGVTGVRLDKKINKWVAYIRIDGIQNYLGSHDDKFNAICARKSAENRYGFHQNHGKPRRQS